MAKKRLLKQKIIKIHKQGELELVMDYIFKPLLKYRPDGMELRDWLDFLFGAEFRDIKVYAVGRECTLKGRLLTKYGKKDMHTGERKLFLGDMLYVRTDTREENRIDVEVVSRLPGRKSRIYELNFLQWQYLKRNLSE